MLNADGSVSTKSGVDDVTEEPNAPLAVGSAPGSRTLLGAGGLEMKALGTAKGLAAAFVDDVFKVPNGEVAEAESLAKPEEAKFADDGGACSLAELLPDTLESLV